MPSVRTADSRSRRRAPDLVQRPPGTATHALRGYKEGWARSDRFIVELAAVLWRFLDRHEPCLARRVGVSAFPVVTTVPSGKNRDAAHPLHRIVGELVDHTAGRYRRLLEPSGVEVEEHADDIGRYQGDVGPRRHTS